MVELSHTHLYGSLKLFYGVLLLGVVDGTAGVVGTVNRPDTTTRGSLDAPTDLVFRVGELSGRPGYGIDTGPIVQKRAGRL